ncbi:MAG: AAA family ATPase [Phycisphaerae bacterium]|nr:AAA family ATPase [Phycisphaerae bacterium]
MRPTLWAAGVRPPGVSRVNGNKETVFVKGILPQAMQEGHILQMDEVDAMQPEVGFILQQILEPHGHLLLTLDARQRPSRRPAATTRTLDATRGFAAT